MIGLRHVLLAMACLLAAPAVLGQATVGAFTGGDPGEGLDLTGLLVYAVNVGGPAAGIFTDDTAPGVTVTAQNQIGNWATPAYGASGSDDDLEVVMQSIRWSVNPATVTVALGDLEPGKKYKLQLLFTESCCNRGFDVFVEGELVADEFTPQAYSGNDSTPTAGAVVTHTFVATDSTLNVTLNGAGASFPDRNPTLSGVTLELLTLPADVPALDPRALVLLSVALAVAAAIVLRRC